MPVSGTCVSERMLRSVGPLLLVLLAAACCSGGNHSGEDGKAEDDDDEPGDETGGAVRWNNQPLPENATPREIDVATHLEVDRSDAVPDVMCAIKLDTAEDGPEVRARARSLRVPMLLLAYNWIVDWRRDGQFDDKDKERFARWIDLNIAPDSHQLVAIDYEHPYWPELRRPDTTPQRMAEIAAVYRQIYEFAKAKRPNVRWGFFGLPRPTNVVDDEWKTRVHDIGDLILKHVDVVYLTIYDSHPGDRNGRDLEVVRTYVELTLAEAGPRPVYAFARGRYVGRPPGRDEPIPEGELRAHLGAALDGRWREGNLDHRLAGIILWDSKGDSRARPASKEELDRMFAGQLGLVQDTVRKHRAAPSGGK